MHWWAYVAIVKMIIEEVDITFVASQGLLTLIAEQQKSLDKL
jgi:hypothetical protein